MPPSSKPKLGQNFLRDPQAQRAIVAALGDLSQSTVIEIGPGRVLSGLLRQIDRAQTALNVEDTASLEKTLAALTSA